MSHTHGPQYQISHAELARWFADPQPLSRNLAEAQGLIRLKFGELATLLNNLLPEGPEKVESLRALRRTMHDANAQIGVAQRILV